MSNLTPELKTLIIRVFEKKEPDDEPPPDSEDRYLTAEEFRNLADKSATEEYQYVINRALYKMIKNNEVVAWIGNDGTPRLMRIK